MRRILCLLIVAAMMISLFCSSAFAAEESGFTYEANTTGVTVTASSGTSSNLVIPSKLGGKSVTAVGDYAFAGGNYSSVTLPDTVLEIGMGAFSSCKSLSTVTLPANLEVIRFEAFRGCSALTAIKLPDSLEMISDEAFNSCSALKTISIPAAVNSIGEGVFDGCSSLSAITVASANGVFSSKDGILFTDKGLTLVRYPEGKSDDFVGISGGITQISENAFLDCTALKYAYISGPSVIPKSAFNGCSALNSVLLSDTVTSLSSGCFGNCKALEYILIPPAASIADDAFLGDNLWLVMIGNDGSPAASYASEGSLKFLSLDASGTDTTVTGASENVFVNMLPTSPTSADFFAVNAVNILKGKLSETEAAKFTEAAALEKIVAAANTALSGVTLGDVNGDGKVTTSDALITLRCAIGKIKLSEAQKKAADTDSNGKIDTSDSLKVLRCAVGKIKL